MIGQEGLEMNLISTSRKIWLLKRVIWLWDVIFTQIDLMQLRIYLKMRYKLDDLIAEPEPDSKDLEDWDSWDKIQ